MNGAFYIGATGLDAQQRALEVVANNVANVNTPAFKRAEIRFSEMVGSAVPAEGAPAFGARADNASGVAASDPRQLFTQGTLRQTGNTLDVAIDGDGFIELLGPDGQTLLWRGGTLGINRDGLLTSDNGLPLKANITVPDGATSLTIAADGTVTAIAAGEGSPREIGKIDLAKVKDLSSLSATQDGLYKVSSEDELASADPGSAGTSSLVQGAIENSNVALTDELVSLLVIQRAYAANAQMVQAADQVMGIANELKR